jgi:thymidylate synthase
MPLFTDFNKEYCDAIAATLVGRKSAPRGLAVREVDNYVLTLDYSGGAQDGHFISTLKPFHTRVPYAEAELAWYLSGSDRIVDLTHPVTGRSFARLWKQFSDDGVRVNSAYGQYLFSQRFDMAVAAEHEGDTGYYATDINQWMWAVDRLRKDPDSRQVVLNVNQVVHKAVPTKDFPCCICLQFTIRDNALCATVVFRSQDVNTGLRNDVFTMHGLQMAMAKELGLRCGRFTNIALNLHIYERDVEAAETALEAYDA